jgi:phospholipid/cholesterol/gamma-HCH transport system substrate-binding protein
VLRRVLTVAALGLAVAVVALVMFGGAPGESYEVTARFENAGQVVKGGLVEVAGKPVGKVVDVALADDSRAELTLEIDGDWAPLPKGTHAQIRQFGLSGPASRYIDLRFPAGESDGAIPDGGVIGTEDTTSNVDLDEVFSIFDPKTRKGLRGVFKGSARQYQGEAERAKEGWLYLDPALVSATRLFEEVNRETPELERFVDETSHLVGDVAQRRDELASLVSNLADTTGAISRPPNALARSLEQLPGFLRQANTTYVNLRSTLDALDPLVRDFKPVAKRLRPYTAELRMLLEDLEPTVTGLSKITRSPGEANDLIDLALETLGLRDITVGPVKRNGKEREGAFPAAAEALAGATPRLAFARPYSVDFTGWLDDFSHSGNYDANGGVSRIGTHVNAFTLKNGVLAPLAPALRDEDIRTNARTGQNNRCPGSIERDPGDGSMPFVPLKDFACDPTQLPPGK